LLLARGQLLEPARRGGGGRRLHEPFDQPPRDRRREERATLGDDADGCDELILTRQIAGELLDRTASAGRSADG
jgi:hypothetical protein